MAYMLYPDHYVKTIDMMKRTPDGMDSLLSCRCHPSISVNGAESLAPQLGLSMAFATSLPSLLRPKLATTLFFNYIRRSSYSKFITLA